MRLQEAVSGQGAQHCGGQPQHHGCEQASSLILYRLAVYSTYVPGRLTSAFCKQITDIPLAEQDYEAVVTVSELLLCKAIFAKQG